MAANDADLATTATFGEFLILLGDGASPQVFADPCGVNSRGFERIAAMNETNVPSCTDPNAPSWLQRDVVSLSVNMPFSGVVAKESIITWDDFFEDGFSKDVRVEIYDHVWEGRAKLQNLNWTGNRGQRATFSATLVSDGAFLRQTT